VSVYKDTIQYVFLSVFLEEKQNVMSCKFSISVFHRYLLVFSGVKKLTLETGIRFFHNNDISPRDSGTSQSSRGPVLIVSSNQIAAL
jgi:hypothetical protein